MLGIVQGITEWLPVSSEGVLTLVGLKFFGHNVTSSISMAVFLHLGTLAAAFYYFRKDVRSLFKGSCRMVLKFIVVATIITGVVGAPLLLIQVKYADKIPVSLAVALIGIFLLATGLIQLGKSEKYFRSVFNARNGDAFFVGILQGFSALPGLSRSGLTVSGLLFKKFKNTEALKLSFIMSLPVVLGGGILINLFGFCPDINKVSIIALIVSFGVSLLTIKGLLKLSRKMNFGWFAMFFGILTLVSLFFM